MFDSLEAYYAQPEKGLAQLYVNREICNIVPCEGPTRTETREPLEKWRDRLIRAGFKPVQMGPIAFEQARYCVEEKEGCLTLGWHGRPLIATSAWESTMIEPRSP
ncbi:hypothetical protein M9H77_01892 [Catharanthus roseus]|uniref:Uncharacterized protein n=1 Tax=Catharanthus roseus TaxID=4058 RepID=A0ACC0C706_CATRO|nr:hypothetical protein M9H77_01892 [Catharanthus roseus]